MTGIPHWDSMSAPAFRALPDDTIAVLPLGATEQHGPHLAVSVDSDLIEAVLARVVVPEGVTVTTPKQIPHLDAQFPKTGQRLRGNCVEKIERIPSGPGGRG